MVMPHQLLVPCVCHLCQVRNDLRARQHLAVGALIIAITPVGAAGGLPLPALVGAGGDIADSGGGCRHPNAIAPVTPLTVAIDVATVDVHIPINVDVAIDVRRPVNVHAAMDTGMTATHIVAAPAPSVGRCRKYRR